MTARLSRRGFLGAAAAGLFAVPALGQGVDPYRTVEPLELPLDKPGIYTLYFRYAPPRIVSIDLAGKGKKPVWYMFYQVYNRTDTPQEFYPELELVTKDLNSRYLDSMEPQAVEAIK